MSKDLALFSPSRYRNNARLFALLQSCLTFCDPMDYSPPGSSVHGEFPGKNAGLGSHSLLQGIFLTQGSNLGLLHCMQILYHLSQQGSPFNHLSVLLAQKIREIIVISQKLYKCSLENMDAVCIHFWINKRGFSLLIE